MIESLIQAKAYELGFELVGFAPAVEADGFSRLTEWLDRGFAGEMVYMEKHRDARRHPASILPNVQSVIMLAMSYHHPPLEPNPLAKVAKYAQGPDYHDLIRQRLKQLLQWLKTEKPECVGRGVVDTAPLLERDFARRAGLGWIGKNTLLISKQRGSFLFLAALLTNLSLQPSQPFLDRHCGTCTRCLDACPTNALVEPGWLDARLCISYLTIEYRRAIPESQRSSIDNWLFGCDICQDVCPWNRRAPFGQFPHRDDLESIDPIELLAMDEEQFQSRFQGTPLLRSKRSGLLRNAAILLGNHGDGRALAVLQIASDDPDPLIRDAATWAIQQIRQRIEIKPFDSSLHDHENDPCDT